MILARLEVLILWLARRPRRMWYLAFLLGVVLALGQAPVSLPIGVITSIPILGYCAYRTVSWKQAFGVGWWAGFSYFGVSMVWLIEPFLVEPEKFGFLAPFALAAMSGGLALFWGGAFALSKQCGASLGRYIIGLAVTWAVMEYLRSVIFTGFPWGLLGYTWIKTPIAEWAAFVGPFGLTFITVLGGLLLLSYPSKRCVGPILAVAFFAILAIGGAWHETSKQISPKKITRVRLVQPNAPQRQKWDPEWVGVFFRRALQLTSAAAKKPVDLVIWPETAVPYMLQDNVADLQILSAAAGPNAQIVAGIRRLEGGKLYNSLIQLDQKGGLVAVYDKSHLVPFGEYVPFSEYLSALGFRGLAANLQGFTAGKAPRTISSFGLPSYIPLICYEAIFPWDANTGPDRPDFLLQITNDAWFGKTIGPYQHLVQMQFRAIEQGLPAVRSANTGVSAMIDPYGRVLTRLKLNKAGFLDADLPAPLKPTLYARLGDLPFLFLMMLLGFVAKYVTIKSGKPVSGP